MKHKILALLLILFPIYSYACEEMQETNTSKWTRNKLAGSFFGGDLLVYFEGKNPVTSYLKFQI